MLSRTRKAVAVFDAIVLLLVILILGLLARIALDVSTPVAFAATGLVLVASFAAATLHASGYRRTGPNTITSR
jgi:hypothetical protein